MTTIGLIRHGVTEWNALGKSQGITDIPLNDIGRKQALHLGDRLAHEEPWDIIITSDLSRASETARLIGSKMNVSVHHYDQRLRERDFGQIQGTTLEERLTKWGNNWQELNLGMEKEVDVAKRGTLFLEELAATYNGKRVLVISHGALIRLTLKNLLPQQFEHTKIGNTSLTLLKNVHGNWECPLYNCTKHLNQEQLT